LHKHDSNTFFKKVSSTIITGATGTNVNDISIVCRLK
jgi:glycerate-2-kinase